MQQVRDMSDKVKTKFDENGGLVWLQDCFEKYQSGLTLKAIGLSCGASAQYILDRFNDFGLSTKKLSRSISNNDIDKVVSEYSSGKTIVEVSKTFKVNEDSLHYLFDKLGIIREAGMTRVSSEFLVKEFFSRLDENSAYYFGFILADGNLWKNKVSIEIQRKDSEILEKFLTLTGLKCSVNYRDRLDKRTNKTYSMCSIGFSNKYLVESLVDIGLTESKSTKEKCPDIFKNNKHFWRGIVDGDGSLNLRDGHYPILSLCGSQEICKDFLIYCESIDPKCTTKIYNLKGNFASVTFNGTKCLKVVDHLYNDCEIYLPRKKKIAEEMKCLMMETQQETPSQG